MTTKLLGLTFSEIKKLRGIVGDDWREAAELITNGETDFMTTDNWRFIHQDAIDSVLEDELSSDEYVLGCFKAEFLAEVTGWPLALIEAAQNGEAYEALGNAIIQEGYVADVAREYASADGYGHHFSHYDWSEETFGDYYVFRC